MCRHDVLGVNGLDEAVRERQGRSVERSGGATFWRKIGGRAGAVLCEMKDLGITLPSWHMC